MFQIFSFSVVKMPLSFYNYMNIKIFVHAENDKWLQMKIGMGWRYNKENKILASLRNGGRIRIIAT